MANEDAYFDDFENGSTSGPGVLETADGRTYMGLFSDGLPNAPGTAVDAEGTVFQGAFVGGKPDGIILVTRSDGGQTTETWKNGEKVE